MNVKVATIKIQKIQNVKVNAIFAAIFASGRAMSLTVLVTINIGVTPWYFDIVVVAKIIHNVTHNVTH